MSARGFRFGLGLVGLAALVAVALAFGCEAAAAQAGPFGVAAPEAGAGVPAGGLFGWVAARQSEFYRALTAGLKAMRTQPHAAGWMVTISFAYGVFHAAGPGHGKAVITSYVLAAGETLRRGIALAFVSAFVQGAVAVVFVAAAITIFRLTSIQMTDATTALERTSAAAILGLGLWLGWAKIVQPAVAALRARRKIPVAAESDVVDCVIGGDPAAMAADCTCGVAHIPDPSQLSGRFDLGRALGAVAAVGIRPCTGALIVLVFGFAQGLAWAGVASVAAMALGTGTTVAALAIFAVTARSLALRFAGEEGPWSLRILRAAEIGGALFVLAAGVLLAGAAFSGAPVGG